MCLAFPAEVIAVTEKEAIIEIAGLRKKVLNIANAKVNEFVLVQQGIAVEKIPEKEHRERIRAIAKVGRKAKKS